MQVILASASPRRKQILSELIDSFTVLPSQKEERVPSGVSPEQMVAMLAKQKAEDIFSSHPDALVIGSDTVVAFNGLVLGKPKSEEDAANTLSMLSGKEHSVLTGVCVISKEKEVVDVVESKVLFNPLTQEFISSYVKSGSPMDKAGSYGIQDGGLVKIYSGSYTNIVGFPKERVKQLLEEFLRKTL